MVYTLSMAVKVFFFALFVAQITCNAQNSYRPSTDRMVDCSNDYPYDICLRCGCTCRETTGELKISCKDMSITSLSEDLLASIEELKLNVTFLKLSNNQLTEIPPKAFKHLKGVTELDLAGNHLIDLHENAFAGMTSLAAVILDDNDFKQFPVHAFLHKDLRNLEEIYMDGGMLTVIPENEFGKFRHLHSLSLSNNLLTAIPYAALSHLNHLRKLHLSRNQITEVQPFSFINNSHLHTLTLGDNLISNLPSNAFQGLHHLHTLELHKNPIDEIGPMTFHNLRSLKHIKFSGIKNLEVLPDLEGTNNLEELIIHSSNIKSIPEDFCTRRNHLVKLDLNDNMLQTLPSFNGCSALHILKFGSNLLTDINKNGTFHGPDCLLDLVLRQNEIEYIDETAFYGLDCLETLDLSNNRITAIHERAFVSLRWLHTLNLVNNRFKYLPSLGLGTLQRLFTSENLELNAIPPPEELPMVEEIKTGYGYHCCQYIDARYVPDPLIQTKQWLFGPTLGSQYSGYFSNQTSSQDYSDAYIVFDSSDSWAGILEGIDEMFLSYFSDPIMENTAKNITCHPSPGPFVPCDDIFESWYLRVGVWLVLFLALTGNTIVLVVNVFSKTKMDVSRFLICNLACADFIMGLYLGFLAIVDIGHLGEFAKIGVKWQLSAACKIAGFLGVLSSELSIYTLSVITLERFYTLKYALYSKRLKLKGAMIIMAFGWLFALVMASLPLTFVSSYVTVVCLPMDMTDDLSRISVLCVIILNATSFIVIMCCYASIYYSIQGSCAWNSKDSLIAKRMSILVFSDFACWAPVVFFAVLAIFDVHLISLYHAKVLTVFVLPVNSCANPFLYTLLTKQFKSDCKTIGRKMCSIICQKPHSRPSITIGNHGNGKEIFDRVAQSNGNPYLQKYDNMHASDGDQSGGEFAGGCAQVPLPSQYEAPEKGALVAERDSHGNYLDLMACSDLDIIRRGSGSPLLERHDGTFRPSQVSSSGQLKSKRRKFLIPFLSWRGDNRFNRSYSNKDWDGSILRNNKQLVRRSVSMSEGMLASKQLAGQTEVSQRESKGDSSATPESSSEGRSGDMNVSSCVRPKSPSVHSQTSQRSPEHRSNRSPVHLWIPRSPLSKKPKAGAEEKNLTTNSENTTEFSLTDFEQETADSVHNDGSMGDNLLDQVETEDIAEPTSSLLQENNNEIDRQKEQDLPKSGRQDGHNGKSGNLSSILEILHGGGGGGGTEEEESESSDKLLSHNEHSSSLIPKESLV